MTDLTAFDGKRQRAVIRKLQRNAGLEATDLAQAVGLSYPQLLRYAYGKVPIRSYQLPLFARALGITPLDLAAELSGQDVFGDQAENPDSKVWTFRAALHGIIPDWLIDELADEWEGRPLVNQMSAAEGIVQMAEKRRARVVSQRAKSQPA